MAFFVIVVTVLIDRLPIALTGDIDPLSTPHISQVACPTACGLNIQNKSIVLRVIEAITSQIEIFDELTMIQFVKVSCAGIIRLKMERASVSTAHGGGREYIPVIIFG